MSTTIKKCFKVLETLALSDSPRGISELSRQLDLDKSAVQRIFLSLVDNGYLEKAGDSGRYRPTLRIWELGSNVIGRHETRRLVHPVLRYGASLSGLTVFFAWADYPDVLYLDRVEGERSRPNASEPGRRMAMWRAASGRAVLAFLEPDRIAAAAAAAPEPDRDPLLRSLEDTRQRLFAVTESGSVAGVNSIASPIWGADKIPVGSIALTADVTVLPAADFERVGQLAISLAEQATRVLDGAFPRAEADMV